MARAGEPAGGAALSGGAGVLAPGAFAPAGGEALAPGEAASYDEGDTASHVRGVVTSNRPDVTVTALIIKTSTGELVSFEDVHVDK